MAGWKPILSFWDGFLIDAMLVSGSVYVSASRGKHLQKNEGISPKVSESKTKVPALAHQNTLQNCVVTTVPKSSKKPWANFLRGKSCEPNGFWKIPILNANCHQEHKKHSLLRN